LDTCPQFNGYTLKNTPPTGILAFLFVLATLSVGAQTGDAHKAVLKTAGGGPPLIGFLYAVNDTAVVILPTTQVTPRGLTAALQIAKPISIPSKIIKKVSVSRVRTIAHTTGVALLLTFAYATTYVLLIPIDDPVGVAACGLVTTALASVTGRLIYWKGYRPSEPGFMMRMQKYCLRNNSLTVDR
jgi:hypothetical protein